jgi:hypothetical protein
VEMWPRQRTTCHCYPTTSSSSGLGREMTRGSSPTQTPTQRFDAIRLGTIRRGHPSPPLSMNAAEATIDEFAANWRTFATTGTPSGVAFAIADARSGEVAGMCGIDQWSTEDVAPTARGRGNATRALVLLTR